MRVITFDRGSKRRLRQIRWTLRERATLVLLFFLLLALCILYVRWDVGKEHPFSTDSIRILTSTPE